MQKAQRPCHTWLNPPNDKPVCTGDQKCQARVCREDWGGRDEYSAYVLHMYYICGMLNRLGLFGLGLDQIVKGRARLDVKVSGPGCGVPNLMISTMPSRLDRTLQYIERT